jgi:hypothetical protein
MNGVAMAEPAEHRELAIGYFNAAWTLIDTPDRTTEQTHELLTLTFASRQHWVEAGGDDSKLAIADWQIAHAASLVGLPELALRFAQAAVTRTVAGDLPLWMHASAHEGLARAYAAAGDRAGYEREADVTRTLLESVTDAEDREIVESQLANIPAPA